ncbi:MAG: hypothetical protein HQP61_02265 [Peptococcaceae bacterium]|nr:hypothetical protein [Candidatus Syntrophopropionicum ammoniitolerans]
MIKKLLRQYTDLVLEIKSLEKRIGRIEAQVDVIEHDIVVGSDTEFPYTKKTFHIEGISARRQERLMTLRSLLVQRKEKCEELKFRIEIYISTIPDSLTRLVFQYRYIDGYSWLKVAHLIGRQDESYPRKMIHDKYLNAHNPKNPEDIC